MPVSSQIRPAQKNTHLHQDSDPKKTGNLRYWISKNIFQNPRLRYILGDFLQKHTSISGENIHWALSSRYFVSSLISKLLDPLNINHFLWVCQEWPFSKIAETRPKLSTFWRQKKALTQCSSSMQQILPVCSQAKPVQKNTHLHTKRFRMHSLTRPTIATKMARTIYYLHPSTPEPTASVACQQKAKTQILGFVGTFSSVVTGSLITSLLSESFLAMFGLEFRNFLRHGWGIRRSISAPTDGFGPSWTKLYTLSAYAQLYSVHMSSCFYSTVQLPGASLASVEVALMIVL